MVDLAVQWVAFPLAVHLFRQTLLPSPLGRFLSSEVLTTTQQQGQHSYRITKVALTVQKVRKIQGHSSTHLTFQVVVQHPNRLSNPHDCHPFRISICTFKVSIFFSNVLIDFLKKVNSDYPYPPVTGRRGRSSHHNHSKSYMTKNIIESLPEMVVEEEKNEEEEIKYKRSSRFSVMMDHNEFGR